MYSDLKILIYSERFSGRFFSLLNDKYQVDDCISVRMTEFDYNEFGKGDLVRYVGCILNCMSVCSDWIAIVPNIVWTTLRLSQKSLSLRLCSIFLNKDLFPLRFEVTWFVIPVFNGNCSRNIDVQLRKIFSLVTMSSTYLSYSQELS